MNLLLTPLIVVAILALCPQGHADPAPAIHYAPSENLKHIRLFTIVADADGQNMKGLGQVASVAAVGIAAVSCLCRVR
jgi:hypothetical protein